MAYESETASEAMWRRLEPLMDYDDWLVQLEDHWTTLLAANKLRPTDRIHKSVLESLTCSGITPTSAMCAELHLHLLIHKVGAHWERNYGYVPDNFEVVDAQLTIERTS